MNRTALRVLTGLAAVAIAVTSPLAAASAADDRTADDARGWGLTEALVANEPLVDALSDAREAYRAAGLAARLTLRATIAGIRQEAIAEATTARLANGVDYRTALQAAWERRSADVDTAVAAARSAVLTARSTYLAAVADAFAVHAPGVPVPRLPVPAVVLP